MKHPSTTKVLLLLTLFFCTSAFAQDVSFMARCIKETSKSFNIPIPIIHALYITERGSTGSCNGNSNSSVDCGRWQINTINKAEIEQDLGLSWAEIKKDDCKNLIASMYLLRKRLDEASPNEINTLDRLFEVLATYHSKTKKFRDIYKAKLLDNYNHVVRGNNRNSYVK